MFVRSQASKAVWGSGSIVFKQRHPNGVQQDDGWHTAQGEFDRLPNRLDRLIELPQADLRPKLVADFGLHLA